MELIREKNGCFGYNYLIINVIFWGVVGMPTQG
ncbi:hypothetical protein SAMN05421740_102727 [Parapedobacter koreensis]|uniref:Uncharacterized protein n=1 Tax=Parapedobacter koreensis TaxID=332977 RepID=A0A1H7JZE4_9SPHI|nr:hypothetical protein SAMN05421740_102727 [Parapedobacter koreensis]